MKKHQILKLPKVNYCMNFKSEFENNYLRLFQAQNSDFEKLYLVAKDPGVWEQLMTVRPISVNRCGANPCHTT